MPTPTTITNVIATLRGTASPERFYVVTGHLDSRVTDVLDFTSDAPGADDDGSGVAVVLELTRLFATHQFPGTLVFATVAGEEQGLFGSAHMAAQMNAAGNDVQGMFSNDIVGASRPSTAPSPTRSPCGCSWRACRPPQPPMTSPCYRRPAARMTVSRASSAVSSQTWRHST
ncbi:MAG: M20/M25/M40 family metallo-hydrolase [Streptosporangiaceae bacterium]